MRVLVDTCVWSLALRKKPSATYSDEIDALATLVRKGAVVIFGPIRQELLTAISDPEVFIRVKEALAAFPDEPLKTDDFVNAADFSYQCRKKGIQGSHSDFLICSMAHRLDVQIFTIDRNFEHYSKVLPISIFNPFS